MGVDPLPFILPCSKDPTKSAFVAVVTGGTYGPQMPITSTGGPTAVTPTQLAAINTWIASEPRTTERLKACLATVDWRHETPRSIRRVAMERLLARLERRFGKYAIGT